MRLRGKPGQQYLIETTQDLLQWDAFDTVGVSAYGAAEFVDVGAATFPKRLYRIRYTLP